MLCKFDCNLMPHISTSSLSAGTRIIYERAFLMNLKNSPLGRTPPKDCLPPGIAKNSPPMSTVLSVPPKQVTAVKAAAKDVDEQFDMDM